MTKLYRLLCDGDLLLEPLVAAHREGLRAACAADEAIWAIYPVSYAPDMFDANFAGLIGPSRCTYAIRRDGVIVGMTAYFGIDGDRGVLEIGGSYIQPDQRGTGLNGRIKRLMLDNAFDCGFRRVEFRVDVRNTRSQAAMRKTGAVQEGILRQDRVTWTGHVRDTVLFSILKDEWRNTPPLSARSEVPR